MIGCLFGFHDWYHSYPNSYEQCHNCGAKQTTGYFINGKNDPEGVKNTLVKEPYMDMWGNLIKRKKLEDSKL